MCDYVWDNREYWMEQYLIKVALIQNVVFFMFERLPLYMWL